MENRYTVFSLRVANYLVSNGFMLKGTGVNLRNPKLMVFFFEDTPKLKEAIKKANSQR